MVSAILCLIGSCEAAVRYLNFGTPKFVSSLIRTIQSLVDGQLLVAIESLLSTLSVAESKKSSSASTRALQDAQLNYLLRIGARHMRDGRPLGALVIQRDLLRLFEHICYVSCPSPTGNTAGFLPLTGFKQRFSILDADTVSSISSLASSQLASIDASADFLKFKTSPHQNLSLSLKAVSIRLASIAFVVGKEDSSFPNILKSILIDSTQMAHIDLGLATFDAVAAISINSVDHTTDLNRALRNYVVHTHGSYSTSARINVAAIRLAWCLASLSKDRVVSTLYSLVNVLASGSGGPSERAPPLRPKTALSMMNFDQQTVASSISLSLKTEDQKQQVYSNVIEAIAEMVCELHDEKIAELMISLLGQKLGRVNGGVDKALVMGTAKIASVVNEKDFRRILKLHAKARTDPSTVSEALIETVCISKYI
jgi:phosphatidylinositol 4-kinase